MVEVVYFSVSGLCAEFIYVGLFTSEFDSTDKSKFCGCQGDQQFSVRLMTSWFDSLGEDISFIRRRDADRTHPPIALLHFYPSPSLGVAYTMYSQCYVQVATNSSDMLGPRPPSESADGERFEPKSHRTTSDT